MRKKPVRRRPKPSLKRPRKRKSPKRRKRNPKRKRKTKKKRETRTRKRRKKLKKKAGKLKSSPKMSLQDTTFFLLLQQPTQSTTNKIENKNGVLHTQSTRHRLFIKKRLATTTLSEKSRTSLHKIIPRRSSPRPLNSHSSSLE